MPVPVYALMKGRSSILFKPTLPTAASDVENEHLTVLVSIHINETLTQEDKEELVTWLSEKVPKSVKGKHLPRHVCIFNANYNFHTRSHEDREGLPF